MDIKNALKNAKRGDKNAQFILGVSYLDGEKIRKNVTKAIYWLELAVKNNHSEAAMRLGEVLWVGGGKVLSDEKRALSLFELAGNLGLVKAQYLLGSIYATDRVHGNIDLAKLWYRKAAENGDEEARENLRALES